MKIASNSPHRGKGQVFDFSLPELTAMPSRAFRRLGESPEISGDPDTRSLHCSVLTDGAAARLYRRSKRQRTKCADARRAPEPGQRSSTGLKSGSGGQGLAASTPALPPRAPAPRILRDNRYSVSCTQRRLALPARAPEVAAAISRRLSLALAPASIGFPSLGPASLF